MDFVGVVGGFFIFVFDIGLLVFVDVGKLLLLLLLSMWCKMMVDIVIVVVVIKNKMYMKKVCCF